MMRATALVWSAYAGVVIIGGANFVAVTISNEGLGPFWGAGLRFVAASLIMLAIAAAARIALPRGRALLGAVLYGVLAFGAAYALAYWALLRVPAGMLSIMLATTPLLTAFLAPLHRLEKLRRRTVLGGLLALAGIAIVVGEQATLDVAWMPLAAGVLFAVAVAESAVVIKQFPRVHPLATNGVAMLVGGSLLLPLSLLAGESWVLPSSLRVGAAVTYLIVIGSIALFALFLYTLARLPVTVTAYQTALMPLVTVVLAALILGQAVTVSLLVGAAAVFAGLYVGMARRHPAPPGPAPAAAVVGPHQAVQAEAPAMGESDDSPGRPT